ncbi:MAG: hypothetical protein MZV65_48830 [Chromatiales bacterium]|nr:hypothetical protein [Chromatiales bacterium]
MVDNDLIEGINALLDAVRGRGPDAPLPAKLLTFSEAPADRPKRGTLKPAAPLPREGDVPMRRIVMASAFTLGPVRLSDVLTFRKSVCASSQEREFLQARQFFPSMRAYPNVPLRNFMDVDRFILRLSERHRGIRGQRRTCCYALDDEDPVAVDSN